MKLLLALVVVAAVAYTAEAGKFCGVCEKVVHAGEEGGEEALKVAIDHECNHLKLLASACKHEVNKVIHEIMEKIEHKEPAKKICHDVHLC